jgi:hypothetical protein
MQGNLAIVSGLASRFGFNFVPVPAFGQPGIYGRGRATAKIHPWRLVQAAVGLLLEKQLWKELWQAFTWYRSRHTAGNTVQNK